MKDLQDLKAFEDGRCTVPFSEGAVPSSIEERSRRAGGTACSSVEGLGFGVLSLGCEVWGLGFRV